MSEIHYKGKGEHSVNTLEQIIDELTAKLKTAEAELAMNTDYGDEMREKYDDEKERTLQLKIAVDKATDLLKEKDAEIKQLKIIRSSEEIASACRDKFNLQLQIQDADMMDRIGTVEEKLTIAVEALEKMQGQNNILIAKQALAKINGGEG